MPRRLIELVVRARRLVARVPDSPARGRSRMTARRQLGDEVTQFSFRLALVMDLAYVGIGALGGAAVGRALATTAPAATSPTPSRACRADSALANAASRPTPNGTSAVESTSWLADTGTAAHIRR